MGSGEKLAFTRKAGAEAMVEVGENVVGLKVEKNMVADDVWTCDDADDVDDVRTLLDSRWRRTWCRMMCSRILQGTEVRDMGR